MTFAEVRRYFTSRQRIIEIEDKKRASFDYILADLIGRSIARLYSSTNEMPPISEIYPSLFSQEEQQQQIQQKKDELSALRFKQFAQSFNKNYQEVAKDDK